MRKSVIVLTVLLTICIAGQVFAQKRLPQFEIFGGVAIPLAPDVFKDYYKMGFSGHAQYVIFPSPQLGISFGAGYEAFTFDGDKFLTDLEAATGLNLTGLEATGSASIIELGIGIRPYLTSPEMGTQFYLFGMGTYNLMTDKGEITDGVDTYGGESDFNKIGIAGGVGIELPAGESMNIILQGLYRHILTEGEATSFLGVTIGLAF